jgi:hypothetical protein
MAMMGNEYGDGGVAMVMKMVATPRAISSIVWWFCYVVAFVSVVFHVSNVIIIYPRPFMKVDVCDLAKAATHGT